MFVQIIQGHVRDPEQVKAAIDAWVRDLSPGADGWINSTGGVTDDGQFIGLACFTDLNRPTATANGPSRASGGSARRSSSTARSRSTTPTTWSPTTRATRTGRFVQIVQGQGRDRDRALTLLLRDSDEWARFRPEVLGTTACSYGDGEYTVAVYFTNEQDARAAERKQLPPHLAEEMAEVRRLQVRETSYFDLHTPWIEAP